MTPVQLSTASHIAFLAAKNCACSIMLLKEVWSCKMGAVSKNLIVWSQILDPPLSK